MTADVHWYALLTKSNYENIVWQGISQKRIEVFLPKIKTRSRRKDRRILIDKPLFPGYLFVRTPPDPDSQLSILKTVGAVRLLGNRNGPVPVRSDHIESLKILTKSTTDIVTGSSEKLIKGDSVLITEGPLAGLKGEFVKYRGKKRVVVDIPALQQFAGVEVGKNKIEKIPDILL